MDQTRRTLARDPNQRARHWAAEVRAGRLEPWRLERAAYLGLTSAVDAARGLGLPTRNRYWPDCEEADADPWLQARSPADLEALGAPSEPDGGRVLRAAASRLVLEPPAQLPTRTTLPADNAPILRDWTAPPGMSVGVLVLTVLLHDEGAFRWDEVDDLAWVEWAWQRLEGDEDLLEARILGPTTPRPGSVGASLLLQHHPRRVAVAELSTGFHVFARDCAVGRRGPLRHLGLRWHLLGFHRRAIRHTDVSSEADTETFTRGILQRANCWRTLGDLPRALADLDLLLEFQPSPQHTLERARLRSLAGDHDGALADLTKALDSSEPAVRAEALQTRAELHEHRDDLTEALRDYDTLLAGQDPDTLDTLCRRAAVHRRLGSFAAAADDIDHALRRHPEASRAWLERARLERARHNDADALRAYDQALADPAPTSSRRSPLEIEAQLVASQARWERGWLRLDLGDELGALADLQRARMSHRSAPDRPLPPAVQRLLRTA